MAVVAALVGALVYHLVIWWPHSGGIPESVTVKAPPASSTINNDPLPLTFKVTGGGEADVTYTPGPDGTMVRTRVMTPWKVTVMAPRNIPARDVKMSVTTTSDRDDAKITCWIGIDVGSEFAGVAMSEDVAYGPHALANCL
ncbi:hypothetical protein [Actinoplanes ianthinogenes]|uniref:hypothetical protein n=1 Tax=Actinoplanes ianthinogenes TaxID=122358 RepID=UPI001670A487|nr:hypothetical protein [Actinoplanes ianthinogenes]